ncbi:FAD-binding oxidoreductase [Psychromarinibacter halotolerans]|uniref:FAD-binding oxidoreductase n=1 Tax=Psychromarinibacter halotolerans TaxID=1775175 RepID=A0ABV7GTZ9_9RHOB|nr:FAD-binding oxidoreductase [Psychromarinibacter halotolerans]MDF0595183.1 FAD-binding oxidoreductase [Psychromarinibacter halotolerans]
MTVSETDIEACKAALRAADVPLEDAPGPVQRKSRDFYWYSPILKRQLEEVKGDFIVSPRTEAEVRTVLATCHAHGVPVTVRGGGTGNYGQSMPLRGGCVLSTADLNGFEIHDGRLVAEPGAILAELETACRAEGQELRLFPSTTATATIGGFIAGGSSGVGAIRWGGLRNPANILKLRLLTMEAEPRVIELEGPEVHKAAHAYGVNGVITRLEVPIDPASDWIGVLVGLPDLSEALRFALAAGGQGDILCRMISVFEPGIAERYFLRHRAFLTAGEGLVGLYVSQQTLPALEAFVAAEGGAIRYRDGQSEQRVPPLYELGWNHTTLRAMKVDPDTTYLQMMFGDYPVAETQRLKARFGDELRLHFELTRIMGKVRAVAMPLVKYTDEARLEELVSLLEAEGFTVFNPHRVTLEEGGMKAPDLDQLAFKRETDPRGLLNPGKMIAWEDPDWKPVAGRTYLFGETAKEGAE